MALQIKELWSSQCPTFQQHAYSQGTHTMAAITVKFTISEILML
jgi:hypothetical protein